VSGRSTEVDENERRGRRTMLTRVIVVDFCISVKLKTFMREDSSLQIAWIIDGFAHTCFYKEETLSNLL
jgi:hypothetical protein